MDGLLGEAYPWVKAAHVIAVIFWMAGMLMLPRYFVYHWQAKPGGQEDRAWRQREKRLLRIIINPAMVLAWIFGLLLAAHLGFDGGWLHAKLVLVLVLSAYHGWLARMRKAFAGGRYPCSERFFRIAGEVPAVFVIAIVVLVVVKPF
ncbi:MAG: protoporphyrinogen oxidase HemJ [Alphaproteobacteria bacterium]|nr:MAG: protoporphyrinogen oxidase HemJ [Alphaproteobacteria bacterium]